MLEYYLHTHQSPFLCLGMQARASTGSMLLLQKTPHQREVSPLGMAKSHAADTLSRCLHPHAALVDFGRISSKTNLDMRWQYLCIIYLLSCHSFKLQGWTVRLQYLHQGFVTHKYYFLLLVWILPKIRIILMLCKFYMPDEHHKKVWSHLVWNWVLHQLLESIAR